MQDRIKDIFANSSNPSIIRSASNILRVALQDFTRFSDGSTSTFSIVDERSITTSRTHFTALEELGMQGLADNFQFLPPNRGHTTKILQCIPGLVTLMISWYQHTLDFQSISLLVICVYSHRSHKIMNYSWFTLFTGGDIFKKNLETEISTSWGTVDR